MNAGNMLCPKMFYACAGNAFLKVLCQETIPREEHNRLFMCVLYKPQCTWTWFSFLYYGFSAAEHSIGFVANGDSYGRMFSLFPPLTKLFPNISGYNKVRDASTAMHSLLTVLKVFYLVQKNPLRYQFNFRI